MISLSVAHRCGVLTILLALVVPSLLSAQGTGAVCVRCAYTQTANSYIDAALHATSAPRADCFTAWANYYHLLASNYYLGAVRATIMAPKHDSQCRDVPDAALGSQAAAVASLLPPKYQRISDVANLISALFPALRGKTDEEIAAEERQREAEREAENARHHAIAQTTATDVRRELEARNTSADPLPPTEWFVALDLDVPAACGEAPTSPTCQVIMPRSGVARTGFYVQNNTNSPIIVDHIIVRNGAPADLVCNDVVRILPHRSAEACVASSSITTSQDPIALSYLVHSG